MRQGPTDEEITKACEKTALECPCCGASVQIHCPKGIPLNSLERGAIAKLIRQGIISLASTEAHIEVVKKMRDEHPNTRLTDMELED